MSNRITESDLRAVVERINRTMGTPMVPYAINPATGNHEAQIGNYHLSHAYGGVCLHQMSNIHGGIRTVLCGGHVPKRKLYDLMHAWLAGVETATA